MSVAVRLVFSKVGLHKQNISREGHEDYNGIIITIIIIIKNDHTPGRLYDVIRTLHGSVIWLIAKSNLLFLVFFAFRSSHRFQHKVRFSETQKWCFRVSSSLKGHFNPPVNSELCSWWYKNVTSVLHILLCALRSYSVQMIGRKYLLLQRYQIKLSVSDSQKHTHVTVMYSVCVDICAYFYLFRNRPFIVDFDNVTWLIINPGVLCSPPSLHAAAVLMAEVYYVGVDVGTASVRAALVTRAGRVESTAEQPISIWEPLTDHYVQSSTEIWDKCCTAVKVG